MAHPPAGRLWLLAVGTFAVGVDGFVLAGLLPDVARDLRVDIASAGQLTTAFAISYAIGSPLIASVTGRLDRRVVLIAGMAVFLLGMVGQALGPSFGAVLAGRVLAALGAAAFQANAYAVAGALASPSRRARALAMVGAGASLAIVVGVPTGVVIGQVLGWRAALWVIAGVAVVAGVLCLALPAVRLPVVSLRERLRILVAPRMVLLLGTTVLQVVPQLTVLGYIAPLLGVHGDADTLVVAALIAYGAAFLVGNRVVGVLTDRRGAVQMITVGLIVCTGALVGLWALRSCSVGAIVALAVIGLVGSFQVTPQQTRVLTAGGAAATVALGLNGSMLQAGSGVGAALGGGVVATLGVGSVPLVAAGVALLALGVVLATARATARAPAPDTPPCVSHPGMREKP